MMKKILIALVAILALTQCKPANENPGGSQSFQNDVKEYGIYSGTTPVYAYNIDKHQTSVTRTPSYRFVMQSDDQTEYFMVTLTSLPDEVKMTVDVTIEAVGASGFKNGVRKMELVKRTEEKAWLWEAENSLGVVVAVPIY